MRIEPGDDCLDPVSAWGQLLVPLQGHLILWHKRKQMLSAMSTVMFHAVLAEESLMIPL